MTVTYKGVKAYIFPIVLISSIVLGGFSGYLAPDLAHYLKPLGDVFLNLIFTAIVPMIFFSIALAIARTGSVNKLGRIAGYMSLVFVFTGLVAAIYSLIVVLVFPPAQGVQLDLSVIAKPQSVDLSQQLVAMFTVANFSQLLSHEHILALIVFSILVGLAVAQAKEKAHAFYSLLAAGEEVSMRVFAFIMYYAPIGFFAYFAVLVSELGPKLIESYLRVSVLYYISALIYFVVASTLYAYLAAKKTGIRLFWRNVLVPMLTSLATCSSAASIPANLVATKKMRVPAEIYETAVPLGSIVHKDGSVIGGMFKIAFLFGIFQMDFTGPTTILVAIGLSVLVGTVMGAIPSGGMLGELLIITAYGFPLSVLIAIAAISIIIDPLATMLNVTGNSVSSMMIARCVDGKKWYRPVKK